MLLEIRRKLFFLFIFVGSLSGEIPADLSFLVVDFKFNEEQGVKVCEVQLARGSKFSGYAYSNPDQPNYIANAFDAWISQYPLSKWALKGGLSDIHVFTMLRNRWNFYSSFKRLKKVDEYTQDSTLPLEDRNALASYGSLLYCSCSKIPPHFIENHPSTLIMDLAFNPYRNCKVSVNALFSSDPELARYNPKWKIYPKAYTKDLANTILSDLGCEYVVIKPSGSSLGNGVIIVSKDDLDATLKLILTNKQKCESYNDRSYSYWAVDRGHTFIMEEFVVSDPVLMNGRWYDPTIRYVAILACDKGQLQVKLLDGYCKLPRRAVTDSGDLNALHKSCGEIPYYSKLTDEMKGKIEPQLEEALLLFYEQMLKKR